MGPNSTWDRTPDGIIINGYEYGTEIFGENIPPHARDFLWDMIDLKDVARGFDSGEEYGYEMLKEAAAYAYESYVELSVAEKKEMHEKHMERLNKQCEEQYARTQEIVRCSQMLLENPMPDELLEAIQEVVRRAETDLQNLRDDFEEESTCLV